MPCWNRSDRLVGRVPFAARSLGKLVWLLPLLLLAACGQQVPYGPGGGRIEIGADGWKWASPRRYYPPPGPPEDPWGPYVREASARFGVPGRWVRAVMHQESGGEQQATSPVGAMGLMQVMPPTYDELRGRYQLGDDPYEPRNNIMAGTAYIKEMYDRFGAPGFLAAYNAGPERVDNYLAGRAVLPDETVNYVAAITPNLGTDVPRSGPFAVYASARSGRAQRPTIASLAAGCDVNAAYNPNHPCSTLQQAAAQPVQTASVQQFGANGCDLNAAFDPNRPCTSAGTAATPMAPVQRFAAVENGPNSSYAPSYPPSVATRQAPRVLMASADNAAAATDSRSRLPSHPAPPIPPAKPAPPSQRSTHGEAAGGWAIQVGAFANPGLARAVAEGARAQAPHELRSASLALQPTAPFGAKVLYRARFAHLSADAASNACTRLNHRQLPCVVVRPAGS